MKTDTTAIAHPLTFELLQEDPICCNALIKVPAPFVDIVYHQAALSQQDSFEVPGFKKGNVSLDYIKKHFTSHLNAHVKEFLFKYFVINFLYKNICEQKIILGGEPRLKSIELQSGSDAFFTFELSPFNPTRMSEWKYLPFKAPKRKNYKDLDRQVELFVKEERDRSKEDKQHIIGFGDWVKVNLSMVNLDHDNLFENQFESFWINISKEEVDIPLHSLFLNKSEGDIFFTDAKGLQDYFSTQFTTGYLFRIAIVDVLPNHYFGFDHFKRHFRTKTNKEMLQKLIEVFSYRNDVSQRHAMVEETLKLIFSKHRFAVPNYLVLRQQEVLLDLIHDNPDYQVYRTQKDFNERLRQLAEKQTKETILIDQIAYQEKIQITDSDVKGYLNLLQRPRMKEFIHFKHPHPKHAGQEILIPEEELKRTCMREKTLNFIIYHLTRK